jgi:arylsulfatase A
MLRWQPSAHTRPHQPEVNSAEYSSLPSTRQRWIRHFPAHVSFRAARWCAQTIRNNVCKAAWRRISIVAYVALFCPIAAEAAIRTNFVIIMVDDMGYGDAGCYGSTEFPTPNIDRLASEGMKLTDFHSSGCVCSPTRAGLLTGRYQQRAGIPGVVYAAFNRNRHHGLQLHETTFAEVLSAAGYATAVFGKWHVGYEEKYNPIYQGFDRYVGYVSGNVDFHSHIDGAGVFDWWHQNKHTKEDGYTTHLITKHACDFIAQHHDTSFCVYIAHEAPHDPYQGPQDQPVRREGESKLIYNHREPQHAKRAYAEMMTEMDKGIGEVLNVLQKTGVDDETFVMFFSDNGATGPGSCGDLYGMKGTLWEGGHRVPALARYPGRIRGGAVSEQLAFTIDVLPTLLDFAEVSSNAWPKSDGTSLVPVLTKNEVLGRRQLFWQYGEAASMRDENWKLVINGGRKLKPAAFAIPNIDWNRPDDNRHEVALFDMATDRSEQKNLAETFPDRVAAMKNAISHWQQDVAINATAQPEKSR